MYEITKLVSQAYFSYLVKQLPTPRQRRRGRKRVGKAALINGILQVLINGVAWNKIAWCGCSYGSCFRYFKELQRRGDLKLIFTRLARERVDLRVGSIDTTTIASFEFRRLVGFNGKDHLVGTKVSLYTDRQGRPVDVLFAKGNFNDRHLVIPHLNNMKGKCKQVLNLDMMYMGLNLRHQA